MRMGTANTYDSALQNLYARQSDLATQQEKITSGKNIIRASDDPTGAANAERALTRLSLVATEQRALGAQVNSITMAESTLGGAVDLVKDIRDLVVSAGNGALNASDRALMAQQMTGLRNQLLGLANKQDTNGTPLFGGLGSASNPFTDSAAGLKFEGISGQKASTVVSIPGAMDGQAVWMNVLSGNGTFDIALNPENAGTVSTDTGQVVSLTSLTGYKYSVIFQVDEITNVATYDVTKTLNTTTTPIPVSTGNAYVPGQAIQFDGISFSTTGTPAEGDVLDISSSKKTNVFAILDQAIASISDPKGGAKLTQSISLALTQIDASMTQIQAARGQAGDWMNRSDNIDSTQKDRTLQLTTEKSKAEDLDPVKGLSDFTKFNTNYTIALQSYAQIQKLTLFNYIS